jgi:UDP-2-acetamido-2,6-beta-L-arabino-hexul-4-ose reductase
MMLDSPTGSSPRKTCLVTGARGFIGQNLKAHLERRNDVKVLAPCRENSAELAAALARADVIFHLAGVNRPRNENELETGNVGFTEEICRQLRSLGRRPLVVFSSSVQAGKDNRYGASKLEAEEILVQFGRETGASVAIHRLKNVFGKWCRPNCHSVVATFCHNVARGLPIRIDDLDRSLELVYIDDVVAALLNELDEPRQREKAVVVPDSMPS